VLRFDDLENFATVSRAVGSPLSPGDCDSGGHERKCVTAGQAATVGLRKSRATRHGRGMFVVRCESSHESPRTLARVHERERCSAVLSPRDHDLGLDSTSGGSVGVEGEARGPDQAVIDT